MNKNKNTIIILSIIFTILIFQLSIYIFNYISPVLALVVVGITIATNYYLIKKISKK